MSVVLDRPIEKVDLEPQRRTVRRQLALARGALRRCLAARGAFWLAAVTVGLAAITLAADWMLRLSLPSRMVLLVFAAVAILVTAWRKLLRPLSLRLHDQLLADMFDKYRPGVGQQVANVLQLPTLLHRPDQASPRLIQKAVTRQALELSEIDFAQLLDRKRERRLLAAAVVICALPVVMGMAAPEVSRIWARRWLLAQDVRWPQSTYLTVEGLGDREALIAPRGEGMLLKVTARPDFRSTEGGWELRGRGGRFVVPTGYKPASAVPPQVELAYRTSAGTEKRGSFIKYAAADFRYELPPLTDPLELTIKGGDDWLGPIAIRPVDRPAIERLKLVAKPPGRGKPKTYDLAELDTQLMFLPQTHVELEVTATQSLASAELAQKDQPPVPVELIDRKFRSHWVMQQPMAIEMRMLDRETGLASKPYYLSIGILDDREPRITIRSTGVGRRITAQAKIPLALRVVDDFGIARLDLEVERTIVAGDKVKTSQLRFDVAKAKPDMTDDELKQWEQDYQLAVAKTEVGPGAVIKIRGAATDACLTGPQTGYSRWVAFQVVTPEELFYEILMRQREQRARFAAALESSRAQEASVLAAKTPADVGALMRKHQVIARQVWQIAGQLEVSLQEMALNELGSPQARDLLEQTVILPMRKLHEQPMSRLKSAFATLADDEQMVDAKRNKAVALQKEVVASMQKILDRMAQWESFVDVINQLREILNLQNQLLDTTEGIKKKRLDDVFDR